MEPSQAIPWNKKGKNGINCFFSEETYCKFLEKDTFESRLERNLKKLGIHLPPSLETIQQVVTKTDGEEDVKTEHEDKDVDRSHDQSHDTSLHPSKDTGHSILDSKTVSQKDANNLGTAGEPHVSGEDISSVEPESETAAKTHILVAETKEHLESSSQLTENKEPSNLSASKLAETKNSSESSNTKTEQLELSELHDVKVELSNSEKKTEPLPIHNEEDVVIGNKRSEQSFEEKDAAKSEIKKKEKERTPRERFYDRKRESSFLHERIKYDKLGNYIPCILSMKPRQWSSLMYLEQHRYLSLTHKYRRGFPNYPSEKEMNEVEEFKELERRVKKEQREFNDYLKDISVRCAEDYDYIHQDTQRYVEEKLSQTLPRVNGYPRYYNLQETISLKVPNQQTGPVLQFIRPLLELGVVPKAVLPSMLPNAPLPVTATTYAQVDENYPATRQVVKGEHVWNHEPCSKDPNAEELAMRNAVNLVMSATALKCLIDTQDTEWGKHWEIPVIVKEHDVFDGEKKIKHKVVYLDKPFYQTRLINTREKNSIFYKYALKSLIIRPKQKGHVFTNIKTQQVLQKIGTVGNSKSDRDLTEKLNTQLHNNQKIAGEDATKHGAEADVMEAVKEHLKRKLLDRNKTEEKLNIVSTVTNESDTVETDDNIFSSQDMEVEDTAEGMAESKKNEDDTSEINKNENQKKSSSGLFDLDSGAIDDLETFGMETNWKSVMKGKQQLTVGASTVKATVKEKTSHGGDISELEKLKSELKGLESKAKKETEKVHNLNITTPTEKLCSGATTKRPGVAVGSAIPDASLNKHTNVRSEVSRNVETPSSDNISQSTKLMHDSVETTATVGKETETESTAKQVLNLKTVEKLTSTGMQLSSGLNLRRNIPICSTHVSQENLSKTHTIVKDQPQISASDFTDSKASSKMYSLRSKTVKGIDSAVPKMNIKNVREDEDMCDDDDDDGLVIDIPDLPKQQIEYKCHNAAGENTPESRPASPPASPPGSPTTENPASPVIETPVSPDKTGMSPFAAGLHRTCVIIPLGDDSEDQNVIDHSRNTMDLNIIKQEIKVENQSALEETEFLNRTTPSVTNEQKKEHESANISDNMSESSVVSSLEKTSVSKFELVSEVPKRRMSLRSAGKSLEESNTTEEVKQMVLTRRRTRQSLVIEQIQAEGMKHKKDSVEDNSVESLETGPHTKRQGEMVLKHKGMKENTRMPRSRSSDDKNEETSTSPGPERKLSRYSLDNEDTRTNQSPTSERRITRHSLDSEETRTNLRPDRRKTRHSLDSSHSKDEVTKIQTDFSIAQKRRKTCVLESDEEETEATVETVTNLSAKEKIAAKLECAVETKKPARKGRPPKKKPQNDAEADKIKELAEKLKKQMKEKQTNESKEKSASGTKVNIEGNNESSDTATHPHSLTNKDKLISHTNEKGSVSVASETQKNKHVIGTKPRKEEIQGESTNLKPPKNETETVTVSSKTRCGSKEKSSTSLDTILNLQSEMLKPTGPLSSQENFAAKSGLTNLAFPVSGNVIYTQWNLGGLNIMIRCSQHGNIKDATHKNGYVYVTPKLEYQPTFGVEQETISEIARNWISVYVRPTCSLLRARINVFTSEILLIEEMDYQSLIPPTTVFSQFKAFSQLHNICQKLTGLSSGNYLLTYTPGDEEINLLKNTEGNKRGAYDLHFRHTDIMGADSKTTVRPWLPIDPTILTAQHRKMGRIPLTFQPKDCHMAKKVAGKSRKKKKQRLSDL